MLQSWRLKYGAYGAKNPEVVTVLKDVPHQLQAATVISPLTFEHPLTRGLLHRLMALLLVQVLGI